MSQYLHHEPCDRCGSSDAKARYSDGTAWCWRCSSYFHADEGVASPGKVRGRRPSSGAPMIEYTFDHLADRRISKTTCQKFRYGTAMIDGKRVHVAEYCDHSGRPVAQHIRQLDPKDFGWRGEPKAVGLFGQQLFTGNDRRKLTITEGEIDAMSVSQAFGNKYAVVSVPNGASSAAKYVRRELEWVESFAQVVICFDQDEPGRQAAREVAELLTPGKAAIAQLPLKDANEMVVAGRDEELVRAIYDARPFRPDGVVNGRELWEKVSAPIEQGFSYPWLGLNEKTHGMRRGELVTWCAGTGIGKSSFTREIAHHLAVGSHERVGIVALEESTRRAGLAQMSIAAGRQLHLPGERAQVSDDEFKAAFEATLGTGNFVFYDHFGSLSAATLLPKLRFLVVGEGCRWIILDHVSIVVSGNAGEGDERKRIDELMTALRSQVEELGHGLHLVSHLRRSGQKPHEEGGSVSLADLRGSQAIAQLSDLVIGIERNQQENGADRHVSRLKVLKNRFSGETGAATRVRWNPDNGRLEELTLDEEPVTNPFPSMRGDEEENE